MTVLDTLIDLRQVKQENRQSTWTRTVTELFPGLSMEKCPRSPSVGQVRHTSIDCAHAWLIDSSRVKVSYLPLQQQTGPNDFVSLLLQMRGFIEVNQGSQACSLEPGALCLLENHKPFTLEVRDNYSTFITLQIPRFMAQEYLPHVQLLSGSRYAADNISTRLIKQHLLGILSASRKLQNLQQHSALRSLLQLLCLLERPEEKNSTREALSSRINLALNIIHDQFSEASLSPESIAARLDISRRHLDRRFQNEVGASITEYIRNLRLQTSASLLRNSHYNDKNIMDIALISGFRDAAHFTRAFKKQYAVPPRQWRKLKGTESL